ncbi:MAG: hypothetical protein MZV70_06320 [Desulfobacterales bacterium]|nr:hypothetical protein [Desulfobacterales bacterium]
MSRQTIWQHGPNPSPGADAARRCGATIEPARLRLGVSAFVCAPHAAHASAADPARAGLFRRLGPALAYIAATAFGLSFSLTPLAGFLARRLRHSRPCRMPASCTPRPLRCSAGRRFSSGSSRRCWPTPSSRPELIAHAERRHGPVRGGGVRRPARGAGRASSS